MEEKNIAEKTFEKIDKEKIKPKPRWHFALKNYLFWLLVAISVIVGAIAFDIMLFILANHDWLVYEYLGRGILEFILVSIPYFWILTSIIFFGVAYYIFRNTKNGSRCGTCLAASLGAFMIIILGIIFFWFGLKSEINENFLRETRGLAYNKYDVWNNAKRGLLGGEITDFEDINGFDIKDFNGAEWHINGENATVSCCFTLKNGVKIKIIGKIEEGLPIRSVCSNQLRNIFIAKQISPWGL